MSEKWKKRGVLAKRNVASPVGLGSGWYSRGYLPHFDAGEIAQSVTFRLFDSIPLSLFNQWRAELAHRSEKRADVGMRSRMEAYLDRGTGSAWMREERIADLVQEALLFFDESRYRLHAWVVMPNHVHVLLTPGAGWVLGQILHSWKSFTSNKCNKLLGRCGEFWQKENFDRYVRDERHFYNSVACIEEKSSEGRAVRET